MCIIFVFTYCKEGFLVSSFPQFAKGWKFIWPHPIITTNNKLMGHQNKIEKANTKQALII
jgi:hypothetical protein